MSAVVAIERRNPIPPNVYWIDVQGGKVPAFEAWLKKNAETVILESREDERRVPRSTPLPGTSKGTIASSWFLFTVLQPTLSFPQTTFGFPTIAGDVKRKSDTAQRPPTPTAADAFGDIFGGLVGTPTTLLVVVGVVWWLSSQKGRN